jgi:protein-arginine kinase activator protein McsA
MTAPIPAKPGTICQRCIRAPAAVRIRTAHGRLQNVCQPCAEKRNVSGFKKTQQEAE